MLPCRSVQEGGRTARERAAPWANRAAVEEAAQPLAALGEAVPPDPELVESERQPQAAFRFCFQRPGERRLEVGLLPGKLLQLFRGGGAHSGRPGPAHQVQVEIPCRRAMASHSPPRANCSPGVLADRLVAGSGSGAPALKNHQRSVHQVGEWVQNGAALYTAWAASSEKPP